MVDIACAVRCGWCRVRRQRQLRADGLLDWRRGAYRVGCSRSRQGFATSKKLDIRPPVLALNKTQAADMPPEVVELVERELRDLGYLDEDQTVSLQAKRVLMRMETDVEARIAGRDGENCLVECTSRARRPYPYWRVERAV
jgi:hypothetical protein